MVSKCKKSISTSWSSNPKLAFLVYVYVIKVEIKLVNYNLLFTFILSTYINSSKSESISFRYQDSLLIFIFLKSYPISEIQSISNKS